MWLVLTVLDLFTDAEEGEGGGLRNMPAAERSPGIQDVGHGNTRWEEPLHQMFSLFRSLPWLVIQQISDFIFYLFK